MENKNKIIYELKKLLFETKTMSLDLMSLQASKVLDYIYSNDKLKAEYEKQTQKYRELEQNKEFINARSDFLSLLNAICNKTLNDKDSDKIACSNFVEYTNFMLNTLPNNAKENFINAINIDSFSIIDFLITLARYYSLEQNLILSAENFKRFESFKQYDEYLPFYQLNDSDLNSLFPSSKYYLANVLLLRSSLKLILIFLILSFSNCQNIERPKTEKTLCMDCPLTPEEINILKLRKTLPDNRFVAIGQNLNPNISQSNVAQKSLSIRNKLGVKTIDEAVRIFENKYFNLNQLEI